MEQVNDSLYKEALADLKRRREKILSGGVNCIPIGMPKFEEYFPGIEKESLTILSADTGAGKTKLAKSLFVDAPIEFITKNPNAGIKLKIFYFCFEESKKRLMQSLMNKRLAVQFNKRTGIKGLRSTTSAVNIAALDLIENDHDYYENIEKYLDVIDDVSNPWGIYKVVEDYFQQEGELIKKEVTRDVDGLMKKIMIDDYYVPNHPDHYVIVVIDHLSLINPGKKYTDKREAMTAMSEFGMKLRDKYAATVCLVQQQSIYSKSKQFNNKGENIAEKLEPSIANLGDNKTVARDADNILFLFAPDIYKIPNHEGYDIDKLGDSYRALIIGKARDGEPGRMVPLFFDGKVGKFTELPHPRDMTASVYEDYLNTVRAIHGTGTELTINFDNIS